MQNQQKESDKFGMKENFNLMYFLASCLALCLTPFLRSGFGMEAFGVQALIAGGMIWCYGSFTHAPEMFVYFLVWLVAVVKQRAQSIKADRQGEIVHSRYQGWPVAAMRLSRVEREVTAKLVVEPLMCLMAGLLLCLTSSPMGLFVIWGSFSLFFIEGVHRQLRRARVRRLRDAQIEQEQLVRQVTRLTDDF